MKLKNHKKFDEDKIKHLNMRLSKRLMSLSRNFKVEKLKNKVRSFSACLNDRIEDKLSHINGPKWFQKKAQLIENCVLGKIRQEATPTKTHSRLWDYYFELIRKSLIRKKEFLIQKFVKPSRGLGPWPTLWNNKVQMLKERSPYSHFESLRIRPMIIKSGDDLRQEFLALSLIRCFKNIFDREKCNIFLHPYDVIIRNYNSGFIGRTSS
jgi:hypothetical protein